MKEFILDKLVHINTEDGDTVALFSKNGNRYKATIMKTLNEFSVIATVYRTSEDIDSDINKDVGFLKYAPTVDNRPKCAGTIKICCGENNVIYNVNILNDNVFRTIPRLSANDTIELLQTIEKQSLVRKESLNAKKILLDVNPEYANKSRKTVLKDFILNLFSRNNIKA